MCRGDEIKIKKKMNESSADQIKVNSHKGYIKIYIISLKVLRVKKQNKNKIKNRNFIFLEGLKS